MMMYLTQPKRPFVPLHILPLAFLLLALAASMLLTAEHRSPPPQPGFAASNTTTAPLSPFGSSAAMRNLLF